MENRKPYNVKNIILAYNIIQVVYNMILFSFVSINSRILENNIKIYLILSAGFILSCV